MSEPNVLLDIKDRIATVTLNDPERRNPITGNDMIEALLEKFAKVQADPEVSVMILTGAGSAFCAGGDIKEMNDPDGVFRKEPLAAAQSYVDGVQKLPQALYNLDIPTIAAVNGAAVGAGCDLTMMCDMRIASEKAKFGEVFLNLGIIPGDAGSWFLLRRLGHQRAADLTFSGRMVAADEALEIGMVLEVVPHDTLLERARERAAVIAAKPPRAVRIAKRLMRNAERMDLPDFLNSAAAYQALMHQTEDHHEAVSAFIEKRKPHFTGR
ncbi:MULTISPECIES: enoyl-CoA hydratase-related protein [Alphaproteobacteria]|jgi:enoyl-CoA hydratase/carnithine racemase|uniref:Enoyl-CoA hydratase echA8 n=1 Tax=Sulfitobacter pontiacus TaxID=60137 RepID=A0AAX3AI88_9RHOB|nr:MULTISPECIES: enoyl-CoA hydratase-related protein [Sulfitobacter]AXI52445.1 enoyl-CoA hydratase [Sulfitobacter sp. SK025]UOA24638.1 putative enoyl-CoA hydratase echA8 [Sulfitobacter pontiacus]WPZ27021.1 enoyl-CoA hydratase-related protein [Sulfitobacter pontiacus]HJO50529.1 enoyl-CoA hydratase-related protein [Sulfitobacter pontiacus]|tara:strand:- start:4691 stop:5494 length:804 start_codon:yes stop_codon:yes gene_type:complete